MVIIKLKQVTFLFFNGKFDLLEVNFSQKICFSQFSNVKVGGIGPLALFKGEIMCFLHIFEKQIPKVFLIVRL